MKRERVVITGIGAISPLGSSIELLWNGLVAGKSGIRKITQFDASGLPCQIAGEIPDFDPKDFLDRKEIRRNPRSAQIALASAIQAMEDAKLNDSVDNRERAGVVFGTTMGGLDWLDEAIGVLRTKGYERVNPFSIPGGIPNLSSFLISKRFNFHGPNFTVTTACATGTQTIGEGAELIRRGVADVVITGGTEAIVKDFAIAGFVAMRALPINFNDNPSAASRPFDAAREGFVFSEGAGSVVLEKLEHALNRGAYIYAELIGYASSSDGYHIAAPHPNGAGPKRAMRSALKDGAVLPEKVDYINSHGSSTPLNDLMETNAIKEIFGPDAYDIPVTSTKSMLGHAMGASGTLEAITCILAIKNNIIPPTINLDNPDPDCDLDYVPNQSREHDVNIALSNSFGLGGQNACLILKNFTENEPE